MGQHRLYGRLGHQIGGPHIQAKHPIERFEIDIFDQEWTIHASIIDQNVELHFDQIFDESEIGYIADHGPNIGVLIRKLLQICTISSYRMNYCACLCEAKGDSRAQPSTGSGYDGNTP